MAIDFNYKRKDPNEYASVQNAKAEMDKYSTYTMGDAAVNAQRLADDNRALQPADWDSELMSKDKLEAWDAWKNRPDFSYDVNGDALYQQYKDQYMTQGRLAMMDTMGQAAAMTGGYGNSYASTAGNQAYQGYLQKLNEVVPELYNMAYNRYLQEGEDLKYAYDVASREYDTKYGEWADSLAFWQSEQSRLDTNAHNAATLDWTQFSDNRSNAAGLWSAALDWATQNENTLYNNAFDVYKQDVAEDQWQDSYLLQERQADQSDTIESLQEQVGNLEDELAAYKGPDYSGWDTEQWVEYFSTIKNKYGKAAAEEQLSELAQSGDLPTEHIANVAVVVRGSLGH